MDTLPVSVCELAARLGIVGGRRPRTVSFRQQGTMRQPEAKRWTRFRAVQQSAVETTQFSWKAHMGPLGIVRVVDRYDVDGGALDARLLGIVPLASLRGAEITRGEKMRYLAELAWVPDAIVGNPDLQWREAGDRLAVAISGEPETQVEFTLDSDGRIGTVAAEGRPRAVGNSGFVDTPWWGRFADYRRHERRWIPFSAEVGWTIDGSEVPVWRGALTDWRSLPQP